MCAVFAALPKAAGDARRFTASVLEAWKLSHVADTAQLLVSELITNAVKHAGGALDPNGEAPAVMLALSLRGSLLIEVSDRSSAPPVRRTATADDDSGRGLELVDLLSKEWGCRILPAGGKITWCVLEADGHDAG